MSTSLKIKRVHEATAEPPSIPNRLYFKIGDVARICGVEPYVLRFWETQFPQLKPKKSGTGQRLYRRRDVEIALEVKRLAHEKGYTLAGAREVLGQTLEQGGHKATQQEPLPLNGGEQLRGRDSVAAAVGHARAELREIATLLAAPAAPAPRRRAKVSILGGYTDSLFPF